MPLTALLRSATRLSVPFCALLLSACANLPQAPTNPDWERHRQEIDALGDWTLSGRLNVRQEGQSDTVQINWNQQTHDFDLRLSGSLGLGAVRVYGNPGAVTVEKAGTDSVTLPSLAALTREYFGYEFPAAQLQYWVRGIPAPDLPARTTLDASQLLQTLNQRDAQGRQWELSYDRYQQSGTVFLPGRIRVQRAGLQLTFLVSDWQLPPDNAGAP